MLFRIKTSILNIVEKVEYLILKNNMKTKTGEKRVRVPAEKNKQNGRTWAIMQATPCSRKTGKLDLLAQIS